MCVFGRFSLVSCKDYSKSKHKLNRRNATTLDENDNRNMRVSYRTRMNVRIGECDVKIMLIRLAYSSNIDKEKLRKVYSFRWPQTLRLDSIVFLFLPGSIIFKLSGSKGNHQNKLRCTPTNPIPLEFQGFPVSCLENILTLHDPRYQS